MQYKSLFLAFVAAFIAADASANKRQGPSNTSQSKLCVPTMLGNLPAVTNGPENLRIQYDARLHLGRELLESNWHRV